VTAFLLQESFQQIALARGLDHIPSLLFLTVYGDVVVCWADVFHYAKGHDPSKIQPRYHTIKHSIYLLAGLLVLSELVTAQTYSPVYVHPILQYCL
jgi:Protein of unknown function (DUF1084)